MAMSPHLPQRVELPRTWDILPRLTAELLLVIGASQQSPETSNSTEARRNMSAALETAPSELVQYLKTVLLGLHSDPYPYVPNPPTISKRASVALIIRIQPHYSHWPSKDVDAPEASSSAPASIEEQVNTFFDQDWVRYGDPEVLFIKRAERKGDRWTSHVALPGGRRDPEDADDQATAVRETLEEVGIDLSAHALQLGNLPQRVVTTSWGKVP